LLTSYIIPGIIAAPLLVVAGSLYLSCAAVNLHLEVVNYSHDSRENSHPIDFAPGFSEGDLSAVEA
jgi:hypothetical protein